MKSRVLKGRLNNQVGEDEEKSIENEKKNVGKKNGDVRETRAGGEAKRLRCAVAGQGNETPSLARAMMHFSWQGQ